MNDMIKNVLSIGGVMAAGYGVGKLCEVVGKEAYKEATKIIVKQKKTEVEEETK